jgi:DNA-binding NarL/FixJ family response regulator
MPVRILIVDDHDIVRQGVRTILRSRVDWEICGEAENGIEALTKIAILKPDVVVLDLSMPEKDGLAVATELPQTGVNCKTLVLTMHNSVGTAAAIRKTGAQGYVVKSHAAQHLIPAIETVLSGGVFFNVDPGWTKPDWTKPDWTRDEQRRADAPRGTLSSGSGASKA